LLFTNVSVDLVATYRVSPRVEKETFSRPNDVLPGARDPADLGVRAIRHIQLPTRLPIGRDHYFDRDVLAVLVQVPRFGTISAFPTPNQLQTRPSCERDILPGDSELPQLVEELLVAPPEGGKHREQREYQLFARPREF